MTESAGTGAAGFARAWASALTSTCYLPMERAELEDFLTDLTRRLTDALVSEPFDAQPAVTVGEELVGVHVTAAEGLGATLELFGTRLLAEVSLTDPPAELPQRLSRLVGAVATGFARALRDRTLDEQEQIRRAALFARQQAESALRESEARFRYQATHDPLTRLANRTLFTERLSAICETHRAADDPHRVGVYFIDLDGFKVVNDTLGHHVGDLLLTTVADRLRQRMADQLVARLGGDEFVVLVDDARSQARLGELAETALATIAEPIAVEGHELTVSASIGVVSQQAAATDPNEVMRAADITLQHAKTAGKGRWAMFDPKSSAEQMARYAMSAAMPTALDRGEFILEYQPLVALADGATLGAEALVRWQHPEWGRLLPGRFIGLAEETGLIVRLGAWVLEEACQRGEEWLRLHPGRPFMSVNLAVRQVHDPGLYPTVVAALERTGLPPDRLQLEITESAVIGTDPEPVRVLRRLAKLGIRIAIDDFGTGYSNLSYLRQLPVCELKIAGDFVAGLRTPADRASTVDERILATLVSLAHTLGLTVTVDGVESERLRRRLREIGCDAVQGFHTGRPMPYPQLVEQTTGRRPTAATVDGRMG